MRSGKCVQHMSNKHLLNHFYAESTSVNSGDTKIKMNSISEYKAHSGWERSHVYNHPELFTRMMWQEPRTSTEPLSSHVPSYLHTSPRSDTVLCIIRSPSKAPRPRNWRRWTVNVWVGIWGCEGLPRGPESVLRLRAGKSISLLSPIWVDFR